MPSTILIADSGATKTSWCLLDGNNDPVYFSTQGISPYFLSGPEITALLRNELPPSVISMKIGGVHFYGTGCSQATKKQLVAESIKAAFPGAEKVQVETDLLGAARGLCGHNAGVACILGTGSNSCFFNGEKILKNNPSPGYVLGDEGSGAYLGKKVLQYFIYQTFDEDLMHKFRLKFNITYEEVLQKVYKEPHPNRFLAGFARFLSENRGHYMVENIVEDGIGDFFYTHLYKYSESWTHPLHFTGGIAWAFRDVVMALCEAIELQPGKFLKEPMEGLVAYHRV